MTVNDLIKTLNETQYVPSKANEIISMAQNLFKEASRANDYNGILNADYHLAFCSIFFTHNYSKAANYVSSLISNSSELNKEEFLMKGYYLKGLLDIHGLDPYSGIEDLLMSLRLARKLINLKLIAACHNAIGDVFAVINDREMAMKYYEEARDIAIKNNIPKDIIFQKILLDYTLLKVDEKKFDFLSRQVNIARNELDKELAAPFSVIEKIVEIEQRCSYSTKGLVDIIYKIFLFSDEITDPYIRCMILLRLKDSINMIDDSDLIIAYCDFIESLALDQAHSHLVLAVYNVKYTLLGTDFSDDTQIYLNAIRSESKNILSSLDKSIKRILELNKVVVERDSEIEKNKKLMDLASIDDLTKLYNRRYTENEIKLILNDRTKESYAFVIIDVDKFKEINDVYGHNIGDKALVFIADTLNEVFDKDAIISRLGGDEFIVMLYNLPTQYEIRYNVVTYKFELLQQKLDSTPLDFIDNKTMSVSIGSTLDGNTFDALYENSDVALYDSKYNGRGQWHIYPDKTKVE